MRARATRRQKNRARRPRGRRAAICGTVVKCERTESTTRVTTGSRCRLDFMRLRKRRRLVTRRARKKKFRGIFFERIHGFANRQNLRNTGHLSAGHAFYGPSIRHHGATSGSRSRLAPVSLSSDELYFLIGEGVDRAPTHELGKARMRRFPPQPFACLRVRHALPRRRVIT